MAWLSVAARCDWLLELRLMADSWLAGGDCRRFIWRSCRKMAVVSVRLLSVGLLSVRAVVGWFAVGS